MPADGWSRRKRIANGSGTSIQEVNQGSQIDIKPIRDYDEYVGKKMEFKVVKINHEFLYGFTQVKTTSYFQF